MLGAGLIIFRQLTYLLKEGGSGFIIEEFGGKRFGICQ